MSNEKVLIDRALVEHAVAIIYVAFGDCALLRGFNAELAASPAATNAFNPEAERTAAYNVIAARDRHIAELEAELAAVRSQEPIGYVSENDWSCAYLHHDNTPGNPVYAAAGAQEKKS